jgi:hypothetical protein
LHDILKEGECEVETRRGWKFFEAKTNPLANIFVRELFEAGLKVRCILRDSPDKDIREIPNFSIIENILAFDLSHRARQAAGPGEVKYEYWPSVRYRMEKYHNAYDITVGAQGDVLIVPTSRGLLVSDEGLSDLQVRIAIDDKDIRGKAMKAARKFGRAWEAKSKRLKGSREATIKIYQDFA